MDFCYLKIGPGPALDVIHQVVDIRKQEYEAAHEFAKSHGAEESIYRRGYLQKDTVCAIAFANEPIPKGWKIMRHQEGKIWCSPDKRTKVGKEAKAQMKRFQITGFLQVAEQLEVKGNWVLDGGRMHRPAIGTAGDTWIMKIPISTDHPYKPPNIPGVKEITGREFVALKGGQA